MGTKDFEKGMEAGAKPYEAHSEKLAEALKRTSTVQEAGMDKISGTMDAIIDDMSSLQKKQLYDLNTQYDIKKMEDYEKELLLAGLLTLADDGVNENQQGFIRSVKKYLDIKNPQTQIDLAGIENIENLTTQKALYQTFGEFLFLANEDDSFLDEKEDFLEYFSVKQKDRTAILECIHQIYNATGAAGLAEKYGFTAEEENKNTPDNAPVATEKLVIDSIVRVPAGKEIMYTAKEITFAADIHCEGKLVFDRCVITYNRDDLKGRIRMEKEASLTMTHCTVIGENKAKRDGNAEGFLISGTYKNMALVVENTLFYNCMSFFEGGQVQLKNCKINYQNFVALSSSHFIRSYDNNSEMMNCIVENLGTKPHDFECIGMGHISGCTFKKLKYCIHLATSVTSCSFLDCGPMTVNVAENISDCLFENCGSADEHGYLVHMSSDSKMAHCQFVNCKRYLLDIGSSEGGCKITYCEFYNMEEPSVLLGAYNKTAKNNLIQHCLFDGIWLSSGAFIKSRYLSHKSITSGVIEECEFRHCKVLGKLVENNAKLDTLFGNETCAVSVNHCKGLDDVNGNGSRAENVPIRHETSTGAPIGARLDEATVGVPGYIHTPEGKALADFSEAIRLDPHEARQFTARGDLYAKMKKWHEAVADYTEAIRLDRNEKNAYNGRSFAYFALGETDKADADSKEYYIRT